MELLTPIKRRQRTVRLAVAAVLATFAVRSFQNGKRLRAVLAAGGAVAVGAAMSTLDPTELDVDETVDVTVESTKLRCSVCEEPIVPGQPRRPNAANKSVHEACL